ncbi:hypothetical protein GTA62_03700 [Roseobacter sp. HKCCD9010]|uniref:sterol desaturase family protein n=1 Tax=unclassified Roseobacter TaxID=196798 RepID=UPI001492137E|nr:MULTISPECIES: sterol desaturase family protein [unclassified Roseobacter]MBF9049028.1 hypothetical protein [Rhodobacterales bacterium HKCCD4356]NNV11028.1 hypothetical protein [Roseobacter sp. HKCCD7357]NNV15212.1 hypothetical protein [Roseobacter sp. HKCCD8768]NNV24672.1 hypothetical protein [Roseobacter sp. HKCCD8192]NNV28928.1 hypothetical protein [Roseobacter sp. HKCCD9061]
MQLLQEIIATILDRMVEVLLFPFDPENRIYVLYIVSSVAFAWFVYRAIKSRGADNTAQDLQDASGSFLQFLFPRRVWQNPSAWLDLRYMMFHKVVSYFLLFGVGTWALAAGFRFGSGGVPFADLIHYANAGAAAGLLTSALYMFAVLLVVDFIGWAVHYIQHKVPLLWQFHKVHHSAEVMHPISNFREHPIDNFGYGLIIGLGYGFVHGVALRFLGYVPNMPSLLGLPVLMFLFNFTAYNLRHSHVWLRWPGVWSMVFPSPAHHHVHHSCHPDHIDKNFAFMFPVWDVIFRTYHMPEDNRDVVFGIDEDAKDLSSCLRLYWVPFRDAYRLFRRPTRPKTEADLPEFHQVKKPELPAE